jgi:hypothetical protein
MVSFQMVGSSVLFILLQRRHCSPLVRINACVFGRPGKPLNRGGWGGGQSEVGACTQCPAPEQFSSGDRRHVFRQHRMLGMPAGHRIPLLFSSLLWPTQRQASLSLRCIPTYGPSSNPRLCMQWNNSTLAGTGSDASGRGQAGC